MTGAAGPIRILVVDDQALVRGGFRSILGQEPDLEVVGEASDGIQALHRTQELRPDLVLMDVRMPHRNGLDATRDLMSLAAPPKVIVLTTFDADENIYGALRAGASGFLLKDSSPEDLVAAVRATMSGGTMLSPVITRRLIESFVRQPPPAEGVPPALRDLTDREVDVLRCMARGATNAEIGVRLSLAETTVKTHAGHLFTKLGVRDRVQAVILAYEAGLVRAGHADG